MPTITHEFDWPDRLVVGTIGQPGERTFYLQASAGARVVSVVLEKEQSAILADKIDEILDHLMAQNGNQFSVPELTPVELVDNEPLQQPVEPEFRTATMTLGWDPTTAQIVIEAFPDVEPDDADDPLAAEPAEVLRVRIPVGTARAFTQRTQEIVGAGRPICPLCGAPMDAGGHVCAVSDDNAEPDF